MDSGATGARGKRKTPSVTPQKKETDKQRRKQKKDGV